MASLDPIVIWTSLFSSSFAQLIQWQPPIEDITLVELFGGIGTSLARVLEVKLKPKWYIHVDTRFVYNQAA